MELLTASLIIMAITVVAAHAKRRLAFGLLLCLLLGPFALLVILLISSNKHECPRCCGEVNKHAAICPHCQLDLVRWKV